MPTTINPTTMHPHAFHAVRAAYLRNTIGRWAALRYCQLRGVPVSLYTLAQVLHAARSC